MNFKFALNHRDLIVTITASTKKAVNAGTGIVYECCDVKSIGAPERISEDNFRADVVVQTGEDLHTADSVLSDVYRIVNG